MDAAAMTLLATLLLIGVTVWYAISTSRILNEMRRQSVILATAAQITALATLADSAAHPEGEDPRTQIRQLLTTLQGITQEC